MTNLEFVCDSGQHSDAHGTRQGLLFQGRLFATRFLRIAKKYYIKNLLLM